MAEILRDPVDGPSAWKAADVAGDETWMYRFSAAELAEIDAAVDAVAAQGLSVGGFGRDQFALPTLAPRFAKMQDDLQYGRGFVQLRGLEVVEHDLDRMRTLYWGIGTHFGDAIEQNGAGHLMAEVTDRGYDYHRRNVRGYTTNAALGPHQDIWSDVVALLCVRAARSGGASIVASAMAIYNRILEEHPEYLDILAEGFRHDLRGEGPSGADTEVTREKIPVYSYFEGRLSCCFNAKAVRTVPDKTGQPLTDMELECLDYVAAVARLPEFHFGIDFRPGDIQLLNNLTVLHWRTAYTDDPDRKRLLIRLWLNLHEGRPLAPEVRRRAAMGPRKQQAPESSAGLSVGA